VRHGPIALPSDGIPFGGLHSLSFVPREGLVVGLTATVAPHGDWLSTRMAAVTRARQTKGTPPRLEASIVATSHAGAVGTFLTVEFGRQARR
jgi:hypothetical protein